MRPVPNRGQAPVALRLALAFIAVAVLAVALVAILAIVFTNRDIAMLVQQRRDDLTRALQTDAVSTYLSGGPGWHNADLRPALDLAGSDGAQAAVEDTSGKVVASTLTGHADVVSRPLELRNGQHIGMLLVRFTGQGLAASADNVRSSLASAVLGAAGLAAVLALLAAVLVSRRITRPVLRLISAARAMGRGDRRARAGEVPGAPAELQELAAAFDQMAATITAEEQLHRDLVADVAHELRTPVAVLQANTEALMDGVVAHTAEQTASLHEEAVRLGRLVEDLQRLAAAEAAALQLTLRPCDLADVAASAAETFRASFAAAEVSFDSRLRAAPVLGDPDRLHQVITNLLSNALKFSPPGGHVRMTLSAEGGEARLEVTDTGPGITAEELPHVFNRLWRGAHAAGTAGSGIGLAVAAELARAHHGSIELVSEPGQGSRFILLLPLVPRSAP